MSGSRLFMTQLSTDLHSALSEDAIRSVRFSLPTHVSNSRVHRQLEELITSFSRVYYVSAGM